MLMAEFSTAVKYRLSIKIFIIRNNLPGRIKWEQMVFLENHQFGCELEPTDFAAFAGACSFAGFSCDDRAQCGGSIVLTVL